MQTLITTFKHQRTPPPHPNHFLKKALKVKTVAVLWIYFKNVLYAPMTYTSNGCCDPRTHWAPSAFGVSRELKYPGYLKKLVIRCSCNRVCFLLRFLLWSCWGKHFCWDPEPIPYCVSFSESLWGKIHLIYIRISKN